MFTTSTVLAAARQHLPPSYFDLVPPPFVCGFTIAEPVTDLTSLAPPAPVAAPVKKRTRKPAAKVPTD